MLFSDAARNNSLSQTFQPMAVANAANAAINAAIAGFLRHPFAGMSEKASSLREDWFVL